MDSFPADFNLESIQKEPQQFDNTNPSLKEQHIYDLCGFKRKLSFRFRHASRDDL